LVIEWSKDFLYRNVLNYVNVASTTKYMVGEEYQYFGIVKKATGQRHG
jgi:hypothetical protein